MIPNPFLISGSQEPPIGTEDCQRIHYHAIQMATRGIRPHAIPESLPLATLLERARLNGAETYLFHPADIESLFAGVTLAVYRTIRTLYCSRLGRSIKMVWQILRAMATDAGAVMIPYETVWALCLHMEELRRHSVEVQIERGKDSWWIGQTTPDITVLEGSTMRYQPAITWCLETENVRVLAFRIASREASSEQVQPVLYDAIMAHRRPHPRVATGLLWHLPGWIHTTVPFSLTCHAACARGRIGVEDVHAEFPLMQTISETWERGVAGRVLQASHCAALLDTYLYRIYGYGPLREGEQHAREFTSLIGYNQDPAWQFPLLRELLPVGVGCIDSEGSVLYDGLHYTHDLLSYSQGHPVTLRRSEWSESTAWIYLDGEILCQAHAKELRRRDGSYRHFRSER